jgi:hypothetical protein
MGKEKMVALGDGAMMSGRHDESAQHEPRGGQRMLGNGRGGSNTNRVYDLC